MFDVIIERPLMENREKKANLNQTNWPFMGNGMINLQKHCAEATINRVLFLL